MHSPGHYGSQAQDARLAKGDWRRETEKATRIGLCSLKEKVDRIGLSEMILEQISCKLMVGSNAGRGLSSLTSRPDIDRPTWASDGT